MVVLSPVNNEAWDEEEVSRKIRFFTRVYPDKYINYFQDKKRAIVPYIKGKSLDDDKVSELFQNPQERIPLFKTIAEKIKSANEKGLVIIDIHAGNILYDFKGKTCFLIDGGLSHLIGEPILKGQLETQMHIDGLREMYPQFAPECFSLAGRPPALAQPKMDVYAFGVMMKTLIRKEHLDDNMSNLIAQCTDENPDVRPTIQEVIENLEQLESRLVNAI